jgi:hypothetical protein
MVSFGKGLIQALLVCEDGKTKMALCKDPEKIDIQYIRGRYQMAGKSLAILCHWLSVPSANLAGA